MNFELWLTNNNCHIHFGSVAVTSEASRRRTLGSANGDSRLANATVWVSPGESAIVAYEKIHLFDIELKSGQKEMESEKFSPGSGSQTVSVKGWKLGLTICYDLRFSNLFEIYARKEVDVLLIPSSFLVETGKAHWEILMRARAIECQAFVVAAAQGGVPKGQAGERSTFGHSLVVDPWGRILWMAETKPVVQMLEIDGSAIEEVRQQMPMRSHRKSIV